MEDNELDLGWMEDLSSPRVQEWVRAHARADQWPAHTLKDAGDLGRRMVAAMYDACSVGVPCAMSLKSATQTHWWVMWRDAGSVHTKILLVPVATLGTTDFPTEYATWAEPPAGSTVLFDVAADMGDAGADIEWYGFTVHSALGLCGYSQRCKGDYWHDIRCRDMTTGKDVDALSHVYNTSLVWCYDERPAAYLYTSSKWRGDPWAPLGRKRLMKHVLGSSSCGKDDVVMLEFTGPEQELWAPYVDFIRGYTLVSVHKGFYNGMQLFVKKGIATDKPFDLGSMTCLMRDFDAEGDLRPLDIVGNKYLLMTTSIGAPRFRLVCVDLKTPPETSYLEAGMLVELMPEHKDPAMVLLSCTVKWVHRNVYIVARFARGCTDTVCVLYALDTAALAAGAPCLAPLLDPMPFPTMHMDVHVHCLDKERYMVVAVSGPCAPSTKYLVDFCPLSTQVLSRQSMPRGLAPCMFEHRVLRTEDNVVVAVYGRAIKGNPLAAPTSPRRTMLHVYGGFSHSMLPMAYSALTTVALDDTDAPLYAVACVRGGCEHGTAWANAGRRRHKQRTLKDVKAAARLLCSSGLTCPASLALYGKSNGGMVVLATMARWPTLAGAVWAHCPVTDMLRFHAACAGLPWVTEYMDPRRVEDAKVLGMWSPLHAVARCPTAPYPAVTIVTSPTDTCVAPWHSYKMVEALHSAGAKQVRLELLPDAGHGWPPEPAGVMHYAKMWTMQKAMLEEGV
jgi:prolyl oligopeptidase